MAKKLTTEEFIQKAKDVHGDRYDYSKSNYCGRQSQITIICKIHGEFSQRAGNHLTTGGCHACGHRNSQEEFIQKAKDVHNNKYDYSKVFYEGTHNKVIIICPVHGEFKQKPLNHITLKQGCPICKRENLSALWQDEQYVKKMLNTRLDAVRVKYGVDNVMHVASIAEKTFLRSRKWKEYIMPSGEVIKIQGYEDQALNELLLKYQEHDIIFSRNKMPKIMYKYEDKLHRYYPDFYIPKENLIIEVKCEYTLMNDKKKNRAKFEQTLALGYKFKLLVY